MKLTYFDFRGRAEPARFIFAIAGVEYEDIRLSSEQWQNLKSSTPWGTIPVLETDNGLTIGQSVSIARYLARKYNLAGSNEDESAKCDEYVDAFNDIIQEWVGFIWEEKDAAKKEERKQHFKSTSCPNFFSKLNKILKENGSSYLVGTKQSWADLFIASFIEALQLTVDPNLLNEHPDVIKMKETVCSNPPIKAWIEKRPPEDITALIN